MGAFWVIVAGLGIGAGEASTATTPDGLDYAAADNKPHYRTEDVKPKYAAADNRPHYMVT